MRVTSPLPDPVFERCFTGHTGPVSAIHCKPLEPFQSPKLPHEFEFASGSFDHSVIVWRYRPHLAAYRLLGHEQAVTAVRYRPSPAQRQPTHIASASHDGTVRLWSASINSGADHSCRVIQCGGEYGAAVLDCDWEPRTGSWLATTSSDDRVRIHAITDIDSGNGSSRSNNDVDVVYTGSLYGHIAPVTKARFALDGRMIFSTSVDGTIRAWDLERLTAINKFTPLDDGEVVALAIHPNGNLVAAANSLGTVVILDSRTHAMAQRYSSPSLVNDLAFHCQGQILYTACSDGAINLTDIVAGRLEVSARGHEGPVRAIGASPNGASLITGGEDQRLIHWMHKPTSAKQQQPGYHDTIHEMSLPGSRAARRVHASVSSAMARTLPELSRRDRLYQAHAQSQHKLRLSSSMFSHSMTSASANSARSRSRNRLSSSQSSASFSPAQAQSCSYSHSHNGTQSHQRFSYDRVAGPTGPMLENNHSIRRSNPHLHASDVDEELSRIPRELLGTLSEIQRRIGSITGSLSRLDQRLEHCQQRVSTVQLQQHHHHHHHRSSSPRSCSPVPALLSEEELELKHADATG